MLQINPEIVEILKQRWEPPKVFENVLSADDIAFLLDQEENNPQKKTLPFRVFGLNTGASFQRLKNKLDSILVHPYKVTGGNFFRTEVPYRLHADTGIDEFAKLYRIVVFPLFLDTGADPYLEEFTNTVGLIMNKQAVGTVQLREQKLQKTGADFNIIYQADMMVASYLVGHGILRPECAIELSKAGTAGAGETIKATASV